MPPVLLAVGAAAGTAIAGGTTAAIIGGAVSAGIGGIAAGMGKGGGGGGSSAAAVPSESPATTMASLKSLKGDKVNLTGDVKVAKTANIPSISYPYYGNEKDNPWKNTQDWYTTLGGDPENVKDLNPENMPF